MENHLMKSEMSTHTSEGGGGYSELNCNNAAQLFKGTVSQSFLPLFLLKPLFLGH